MRQEIKVRKLDLCIKHKDCTIIQIINVTRSNINGKVKKKMWSNNRRYLQDLGVKGRISSEDYLYCGKAHGGGAIELVATKERESLAIWLQSLLFKPG